MSGAMSPPFKILRWMAAASAAFSRPHFSPGSKNISKPYRALLRPHRGHVHRRHHRHRPRARFFGKDILKLYEEQGPAIFDQQHGRIENLIRQSLRGALHLLDSKYSSEPLQVALTGILGQRRLGESRTRWSSRPGIRCLSASTSTRRHTIPGSRPTTRTRA